MQPDVIDQFYNNYWACEYSPDQNCFHVAHISKKNRRGLLENHLAFFLPIGIFESNHEADECAERLGGDSSG